VFATPTSLLQPVPAIEQYAASEVVLVRGARQPFQELLERLRGLDYDSEAVCEAPGHYAVRGGIIDVYPVTAPEPYRLDFFGDEIEDIRAFDPVTQRSGARVERISVGGLAAPAARAAKTGISDYLDPRAHLALVEPAALEEEFRAFSPEGSDGLAPLLASVRGRLRLRRPRRGVRDLRGARVRDRLGHREPRAPPAASRRDAARPGPAAGRGRGAQGQFLGSSRAGSGRASPSPSPPRRKARKSASGRSSRRTPRWRASPPSSRGAA
jgi:transcription-repair coupling factor (superfamily II helicase)